MSEINYESIVHYLKSLPECIREKKIRQLYAKTFEFGELTCCFEHYTAIHDYPKIGVESRILENREAVNDFLQKAQTVCIREKCEVIYDTLEREVLEREMKLLDEKNVIAHFDVFPGYCKLNLYTITNLDD